MYAVTDNYLNGSEIVIFIFICSMVIAFVFGIRAVYFGYQLLFYLKRCYPDKVKEFTRFGFIDGRLLFKDQSIKDPEFTLLRKKVKNAETIAVFTVLFAIAFMLFLVLIAFIF